MKTKIIEVKNLKKSYNSNQVKVDVLKDVNLDVLEGEFISIMGPSGSGKSTLLYLIGGLEVASGGNVYIKSQDLASLSDKKQSILRSNDIGFVFQFYNLVEHLNVEDNIMLPVVIKGGKKKNYLKKLNELLEIVGLSDKKGSYPRELSGGEQQRVSIARALINSPKIILADEPIGNLDSKTGKGIMELFSDIHQKTNTTIIQVTHSEKAAEYGTRIVRVQDGRLV